MMPNPSLRQSFITLPSLSKTSYEVLPHRGGTTSHEAPPLPVFLFYRIAVGSHEAQACSYMPVSRLICARRQTHMCLPAGSLSAWKPSL